jgi:hypothetical protein
MRSRHGLVVALAVVLLSAAAPLACRTQSGPPPKNAGSSHGVTLPSDVGAGTGPSPSGSGTNGGATGPSLGTPGGTP